MKIAYFDCFAGASGNMILGSLIDAGADFNSIKRKLAKLGLKSVLKASKTVKKGIASTFFDVSFPHQHEHRNLPVIKKLIDRAKLSPKATALAKDIFRTLARAEAKVHGISVNKVHFHEVGAVDSIMDIVGTAIALDELGIEKIFFSPLPLSTGTVETEHGTLPIPAPATTEMLKGLKTYNTGIKGELITPTGAAILTSIGIQSEEMPDMTVNISGYGCGSKDYGLPPVVRVTIGDTEGPLGIVLLETNIDDMNPQIYEYLFERLLKAGALDVYTENIRMKKSRPAQKLCVMVRKKDLNRISRIIFEETTSIGLRYSDAKRIVLDREIKQVKTKFGKINVKVSSKGGKVYSITPEYEDCRKAAKKYKVPLKSVIFETQKQIGVYR